MLEPCHLSLTGPGENSAPGIASQQSSMSPTQKRLGASVKSVVWYSLLKQLNTYKRGPSWQNSVSSSVYSTFKDPDSNN